MNFPKQIWQTWKHHHPPTSLKRLILSFRKINENWKYDLYTDQDIEKFVALEFPLLAEYIAKFPNGVYRADIWRCLILYRFGGIYSDIDVECIRPLDELLEAINVKNLGSPETEIFLSREHPVHEQLFYESKKTYMNFFMIAQPGAGFLKLYLDRLVRLVEANPESLSGDPVSLTGPGAFTEIIEQMGGPDNIGVGVLPWQWVSPLPDMAISCNFPGKAEYAAMIRRGEWAQELNPFVAHYWWHNYHSQESTMSEYGNQLFQTDGAIVSRRLESLISDIDERGYLAGRALAEFANQECRLIVDTSDCVTSRYFHKIAERTLSQIEHSYSYIMPHEPISIGLIYIEGIKDFAAIIHEIQSRDLLAPSGLIYIDTSSSESSEIAANLALSRNFDILECGVGLLMRLSIPHPSPLIPKLIHQTWKTSIIPDIFKREWIESWEEHNHRDGWTQKFWTDADLADFIVTEFPDFADCYFDYDLPIKRVDAARYLILKRYGGVYVDLDFACLKPLDQLLQGKSLLFGTEFDSPYKHDDCVCNAFMASIPNHPFWQSVEHDLRIHSGLGVLGATGPMFLGRRLRDSFRFLLEKDLPSVVSRETLYPFRWDSTEKELASRSSLKELAHRYPNSHAVTFWTASWC